MEEVENQGSNTGFAPQETESAQETTHEVVQEESQPDQQDKDWIKRLRRDREDAIRQAQEERKEKELLRSLLNQQMQQQPVHQPQEEEDIIESLSKEEYVPGEKVAKGLRRIEAKFEKKLQDVEKKYATQHQNTLFKELKQEYPDFEDVVNSETLKIIEETNPRLAESIARTNDPYSIAVQSYEYIKAKGLHTRLEPSKRVKETEAKIEQNKKTVQSPVSNKRPMAQAFSYESLSSDQKKSLAQEMYSNAQRVGMGY